VNSAGRSDVVVGALRDPMLMHHGDTFTLPNDATLLASTVYPQAFRIGSALAFQFHPEAGLSELKHWSSTTSSAARYASVGLDRDALLKEAAEIATKSRSASWDLFQAWWDHLPAKYRS